RDEQSQEAVRHIAEIAARTVQDRHRTSIDRVMAKPQWRADFDAAAREISPQVDLNTVRRTAFQLRKTRELKPELITRLADWGREVKSFSLEDLRERLEQVPEEPGIYLFRDATGYLYIGEAADLRKRLGQHLEQSDRQSLANYLGQQQADTITVELHTFAPDSRIKELAVRRAYESELIRSRNPRFNIRP
ncbi:MAG: GIY-YIG nuclease family protein, partial [Planctomycetota bacterium]